MEEVTDEPLYRDRVCGIDIGKAGMVATIRVPSDSDPARRASETRSFGTTRREVLALADWLRCWQVPAVVMEATGRLLEGPVLPAGGRGVRVRAGRRQAGQEPARAAQAGPGRFAVAGGVLRARRGHRLLRGHRRSSGCIRLHTRYRRDLTEERTREKQRAEKLLVRHEALLLSDGGERPSISLPS